jgi:uncharacterized damage-inducible protein DinB
MRVLEALTMKMYCGKQLAESFRGVRANTITIAEDIPEEQYGFKPVPDVKSVAEQLAHIAVSTGWQIDVHTARVGHVDFAMFGASLAKGASEEQALTSKAAILSALRERGDQFASFLEGLGDGQLEEVVTFPPPVKPSEKTRFEMLLSAKEHEMHHRAQLMVYERMLGIVPHLTRRRAANMAATTAAAVPARS